MTPISWRAGGRSYSGERLCDRSTGVCLATCHAASGVLAVLVPWRRSPGAVCWGNMHILDQIRRSSVQTVTRILQPLGAA
ncbi:hypothetical protein PgNI_05445 [Pyricularia grisea]|uniref:Uncharacterized protein n=1 Tax=Pyricularia grisea TaxID=148305 RepID=A0A6P8B5E1_PYRGI|nr:hypothetical protein PgNI_05445 [Pyricularia grisea]TLD10507.1 hypothetical protein PgNI_05445 [Pyricularia grisea]